MKRMIAIITAALLTCSCSQPGAPPPGFGAEDLFLRFGGNAYVLNAEIESILDDFGDGYEYAEARSCDYDGLDKSFIYDIAEFYTFPINNGDIVSEIYTAAPDAATSRGIRVGSSKADVLTAYGNDAGDTGYQLIYTTDGGSLCFDMDGDTVTAFYITRREN
ncbi:MAG: hypothetical protein FWG94_11680 [Oscillospiraceae bacterium]|nr:hypothetical protein [Oscillospiraceae bacterium]